MKYKYIFDISDDFIDSIGITEYSRKEHNDTTLLMAYKMYYYCYNKYNYTKAGNSLGKLLIFDIVSYNNDREKSVEIAKDYLKREMHRGNINAIANIAVHFYNHPEESIYNEREIKRILKTSASFGDQDASDYLGKLLYDEGKYEEAIHYLNEAADEGIGDAYILIGNYNELKNEKEKAIEFYKKAIVSHSYDGAYYLSLLYYNYTKEDKDAKDIEIYKTQSKEYIDKYYNLFSEEIRKKADILLK